MVSSGVIVNGVIVNGVIVNGVIVNCVIVNCVIVNGVIVPSGVPRSSHAHAQSCGCPVGRKLRHGYPVAPALAYPQAASDRKGRHGYPVAPDLACPTRQPRLFAALIAVLMRATSGGCLVWRGSGDAWV